MELLRAGGNDTAYATAVAAWPASAREVSLWCGRRDFPVPPQVVAAWRDEEDVEAYVARDASGALVAYGELWVDPGESEVEVARVVVSPGARGRVVGRRFVSALAVRAREATGCGDVFLRVHPDNTPALHSYRAAGFTPVAPALAAEWKAPQPVASVWLRHAPGTGSPGGA
ncbi:GNAT family N-acetyltransferase [Streptomyces sp. NPDC088354]|uniref:GNAT family N-acetyltransferase n=1 Tax=unclassified Streptomyces TaxID=2593676 RepID=UPI0029A8DC66|nr:GNAT family N-acetyltransferase [Streptomyces sp. MI02-7b]MDX3072942.1 GNAT family N-acetyltransferase [Streptomyces sp. MI02-7b]